MRGTRAAPYLGVGTRACGVLSVGWYMDSLPARLLGSGLSFFYFFSLSFPKGWGFSSPLEPGFLLPWIICGAVLSRAVGEA